MTTGKQAGTTTVDPLAGVLLCQEVLTKYTPSTFVDVRHSESFGHDTKHITTLDGSVPSGELSIRLLVLTLW